MEFPEIVADETMPADQIWLVPERLPHEKLEDWLGRFAVISGLKSEEMN